MEDAVIVAYSFKPRFIAPIIAGAKRQTLRNGRKRHARPGETLQLYTGMRTRQCQLIGTAICASVDTARIDFVLGCVEVSGFARWLTHIELGEFAKADGFDCWPDLRDFWRFHHPEVTDAWEGVRIAWEPTTFKAPA